jgi:hypothetical protein
LSLSDEMHAYNLEDYEKETFQPILEESNVLNQELHTIFKATVDIESDIIDIAAKGDYDLVLVGLGKSIFEGSFLGRVLGFTTRIINPDRLLDKFTGKEGLFENSPFDDRTRQIISRIKNPLGILVDKELTHVNEVFVPIYSSDDAFLIEYAQKLIHNNDSKITLIDINNQLKTTFVLEKSIEALQKNYPSNVKIVTDKDMNAGFFINQDLMMIGLDSWKTLVDSQSIWLSNVPSTLIIKP